MHGGSQSQLNGLVVPWTWGVFVNKLKAKNIKRKTIEKYFIFFKNCVYFIYYFIL